MNPNLVEQEQENAINDSSSHNNGTSRSRFEQLPTYSRYCLYMTGIIVIAVLVLKFVFPSDSEVLVSISVNNIAERISAVTNNKIDPCQDFSRFACTRIVPETADANGIVMPSTMDENTRNMLHEIKSVLEEPKFDDESKAVTMARQLFNECRMYNSSYYTNFGWLPFFTDDKPIIEWPITEKQWNQSEISLERILALVFTHGGPGIFEIKVIADEEDDSRILLTFREGVEDNLSDDDIIDEHYEKLSQSVQALNEEKQELSPFNESEIFKFKNKFDKLMETSKCNSDKFEICGGEHEYVEVNLDYIQSQIPQINWIALVQHIFDILELDEPDEMNVHFPCFQFFYKLGNLIEETGRRTVSNYLILRFIVDFYSQYLVVETPSDEYPTRASDTSEMREEANFEKSGRLGIHFAIHHYMGYWGLIGLAVAHLYQKKYRNKSAEEIVQRMTDYLKMAFREMISKLTWIPAEGMDQSKNELIEKLMHMKTRIGFPELMDIRDATVVDVIYDGLELSESSFTLNILKIKKFKVAKVLNFVTGKNRDVEPYLDILGAGYYIPSTNEIGNLNDVLISCTCLVTVLWELWAWKGNKSNIERNTTAPLRSKSEELVLEKEVPVLLFYNGKSVIPYKSLLSPMFHEDYPMYLNFANVGFILAHEIVHGFDNSGLCRDKDGDFVSTWPEDFQMAYTNQAICFVEQYEKFRIPLINKFVNGYLTLGENICDNAAAPLTLLAYEMWRKDHDVHEPLLPGLNFTIPQIFYIAFGQMWCEISSKEISQIQAQDVHSPGPLRVKGVIQNSANFGHIFGCPVGTPMNPAHKCSLWS